MKIKALDSFASAETGMVHAGEEFDASEISEARLTEWADRGFIPRQKKEPAAPKNKAEPAPDNKGDAKKKGD